MRSSITVEKLVTRRFERSRPRACDLGGTVRLLFAHTKRLPTGGSTLTRTEVKMDLEDMPHGGCVDCGVKTYLWCQEVNNWHCTSCDTDCA